MYLYKHIQNRETRRKYERQRVIKNKNYHKKRNIRYVTRLVLKKEISAEKKKRRSLPGPFHLAGHFLPAWEWRYRKSASSRRECRS